MLSPTLEELAEALGRRALSASTAEGREQAERLRTHVSSYLLPRASDLLAPLFVVILGSTGAGKSSLFNALAGRPLSPSGLLRPTTRQPVALVNSADPMPAHAELTVIRDPDAPRGLIIIDSPDFDSVERANRELALDWLEKADLVIFVTTVTRYADQVPWQALDRARQRGVPLLMVINRMPSNPSDGAQVLLDYRALLNKGGLGDQGALGALEIVSVPEGAFDPNRDAIELTAIDSISAAIEKLRDDAEARRDVARGSLITALESLPTSVEEIAKDADVELEANRHLLEESHRSYEQGFRRLAGEIENGNFLRSEVLQQWLDFVRAGPLARFLSEGVGRIAAAIRGLFRSGPPPPAPPVREAAFSDLVASARRHADEAARRLASSWSADPYGSRALADHPELWAGDPSFETHLQGALDDWGESIGREMVLLGQQRKAWAQAASIGLNALGTSAMVAVFISTGGLTGTEVGIGAATAFVNQKLLEAIFGEANVASFVRRARDRLMALLSETFARDRERFERILGPNDAELPALLRRLAREAAIAAPR